MLEVELPQVVILWQSLLSRFSEVASFARNVPVEQENFAQLASFLENICSIIIELQNGRDSSPLISEILEALLRDVEIANQLVHICSRKHRIHQSIQSKDLVKRLENVVHDLGRSLRLIPLSSVQNNENTKVIIDSLSQQMQEAYFHSVDVQNSESVEVEHENSLKAEHLQKQSSVGISHSSGNMLNNSESFYDHGSQSDDSRHYDQRHIEPLYEAFVCPLTKQIMRDPVTLENGQTYERSSIERWFKECQENGRKPVCPMTGKELKSTELNPSIALRNTIEEWTARNEGAQIDIARASLTLESSEEEVLYALKDIQLLCFKSRINKHRVRNVGLIPMIVNQLKSSSEKIRCRALEALCLLAEDDEDNKEAIAEADAIRSFVKCLSRELSQEREEAVSLLLELSKSPSLCEKIGCVNGAILILVGMTSSKSENVVAVEKAEKTLENLEQCDKNVRQMAENGRLQPLITRLVGGSEEVQLEMANYLGEIVLSNEGKVLVAEMATKTLVKIMGSGKVLARESVLKALNQISSYDVNGRKLIEAGILPPLIKDLFTVGANQLPIKMKEVSAAILANVVSSGFEYEAVPIDADGDTLVSENIIHNLLHLISNTGPAIEAKLLQVLVGLSSSPDAVLNVVTAIKSAGATINLIQFIEAPQKDLRIASVKLLQRLCPHMGQELADGLRVTTGQLSTLIRIMGANGLTEEHAAAASLLANLPVMDATLTRSLLDEGAFPVVVSRIHEVRHGETRGSRFLTPYLEGLVGVLARFTFLLDDEVVVALAKQYNLASLFTDLLQTNGLDEVQRLSAVALENLSAHSNALSEFPEISKGGFCDCLFPPPKPTGLCPVHHGICSSKNTFCLLEAKAVTKLVACLDHANVSVVEASLAAICTLVSDSVDVERGVQILDQADAIQPILDILQEHKTEVLRQRAVWTVERILRSGDLARTISTDANVHTALVDAFRYGNYNSRQVAEKALKHLNKIPNFSGVFHKIG
ncbi:U-box domain-containing protein 43 [Cryptomeria japonica]|uniref:U-box domain-containing protein 43 n=1 Tax=Cryptomeria japonica TaxID=3369 RepID=UPI0025AD899C|nr:U-box domain-containing protein 43 [Cryptomeria japonica]XP_057862629.1 U-box domain-containing protein 43 [Cryptomeria japonica]XP_057862630.1 U-box domain-containing protein 43 [Cryptomeria japonica]